MFIFLSKLFQAAFRTSNFFLLLLVFGTVLLWTRWHTAGKKLLSAVCLMMCAIALLPIGKWMVIPLETRFPVPQQLPEQVAGIITTNGTNPFMTVETGQPALGDEAEALTTGLWLARKYPQAKLVFTGGSGSLMYPRVSEASAAQLFFLQQGIAADRLVFDDRSRGTQEKAVNCRELLKPRSGENWILVTAARRMPRTWLAFTSAGWQVIPYPVDFRGPGWKYADFNLDGSFKLIWYAVKEWVGLIAYRVTGRTKTLLPSAAP
jgi:uncharacterized SAM-binding protein YcdF (DUF218 family)